MNYKELAWFWFQIIKVNTAITHTLYFGLDLNNFPIRRIPHKR